MEKSNNNNHNETVYNIISNFIKQEIEKKSQRSSNWYEWRNRFFFNRSIGG